MISFRLVGVQCAVVFEEFLLDLVGGVRGASCRRNVLVVDKSSKRRGKAQFFLRRGRAGMKWRLATMLGYY
jgi:hypothetical protein